ncbi:MAG: ArsR family transcriptional regulator [Thermoplasmata archaeon]
MKYARAHPRPVEKGKTEVIKKLTKARLRVIECLQKGMYHPDDIAKHLKITRQAVDPHLQILCNLGIVSRGEGTFEIKGRPRLHFEITREGQKLLDDIENAELIYSDLLEEEYKRKQRAIDDLLLDGKITEEEYRRRVDELRALKP